MTESQQALVFDDTYPNGFFHWLTQNRHIYRKFSSLALEMAMSGRRRYSARTIVEAIRWNTDLADREKTFKINDHYTPGMARLWLEQYGDRFPGFFELRA